MAVRFPDNVAHIVSLAVAAVGTIYLSGSQCVAADIAATMEKDKAESSRGAWGLLRVRTIGYRLARTNATRCSVPTMQTGLILQDIGGFSETDRPSAMRDHGLTFGFGILGLVPGSPAMHSGLRHGDEIVGVNGHDLSSFASDAITRKASYDRVEAFEDLLQDELLRGAASLRVRRGFRYLDVMLVSEPGCGGRFTELNTTRMNAWSNDRYVTVSSAMVGFVANDAELAFVMAHEMAHNILGHNRSTPVEAGLLSERPVKKNGSRSRELEADVYALEIMRRAGYDPEDSRRLFERLKGRNVQGLAFTHPSIKRRIALVEQEIEKTNDSKQAAMAGQVGAPTDTREVAPLLLARRSTPELKFADLVAVTKPIRLAPLLFAGLKPTAGPAFVKMQHGSNALHAIPEFGARLTEIYKLSILTQNFLANQSKILTMNLLDRHMTKIKRRHDWGE